MGDRDGVTAAEAEMNDDTALREQLLEAEMRREMGEISDEEFRGARDRLLARIREIKERREGGSGPDRQGAQPMETTGDSTVPDRSERLGRFSRARRSAPHDRHRTRPERRADRRYMEPGPTTPARSNAAVRTTSNDSNDPNESNDPNDSKVTLTYVYCLVRCPTTPTVGKMPAVGARPGAMPGARPVRVLAAGDATWAIVSARCQPRRLRRRRARGRPAEPRMGGARAMAHETVVEHFLPAPAVLPMQLFTMFTSDDARARARRRSDRRRIDRDSQPHRAEASNGGCGCRSMSAPPGRPWKPAIGRRACAAPATPSRALTTWRANGNSATWRRHG